MKKLAIIIFLIAMLCLSSGCVTQADYDDLGNDYNELLADYNDLVDAHNELLAAYDALEGEHNELTVQFEQYVEEVEKYSKLFEGAIVPPYLLVKGRKVNLVFHNLEGNLFSWYWEAETLESTVVLGWAMREQSISGLEYLGWQEVADRFETGSKYIELRGQGPYLDYRPYIKEDNFALVASELFSLHSDDESRVREVWNMVTQLDIYCADITETPRLPLETLLLGGGDCEDMAILTASILKAMSPEWSIRLVYMDLGNPTDINKVDHVTVHVDTGTYQTFVESTSAETMCPWETVNGFFFEVQ